MALNKPAKRARARDSRRPSKRARKVAGGFVALPFELAPLPGQSEPVSHFVYARAAKTDDDDGRTLFVASLPWASSAADVCAAFGASSAKLVSVGRSAEDDAATLLDTEGLYGSAAAEMAIPPLFLAPAMDPDALVATLRPKPSANVVFASTTARDAALAQTKPRPWPTSTAPTARDAHTALRPSLDTVKAHADAWMAAFDAGPSATADGEDDGELVEVVGDDGWTTVVRGGKHGRSKVAATAAQDADPLRYATGQTSVGVASRRFSMAAAVGGADAAAQVGGTKKRKKELKIYKFQRADQQQSGPSCTSPSLSADDCPDLRSARQEWESTKTDLSRRRRDRRLRPY